eukprot:g2316.t1
MSGDVFRVVFDDDRDHCVDKDAKVDSVLVTSSSSSTNTTCGQEKIPPMPSPLLQSENIREVQATPTKRLRSLSQDTSGICSASTSKSTIIKKKLSRIGSLSNELGNNKKNNQTLLVTNEHQQFEKDQQPKNCEKQYNYIHTHQHEHDDINNKERDEQEEQQHDHIHTKEEYRSNSSEKLFINHDLAYCTPPEVVGGSLKDKAIPSKNTNKEDVTPNHSRGGSLITNSAIITSSPSSTTEEVVHDHQQAIMNTIVPSSSSSSPIIPSHSLSSDLENDKYLKRVVNFQAIAPKQCAESSPGPAVIPVPMSLVFSEKHLQEIDDIPNQLPDQRTDQRTGHHEMNGVDKDEHSSVMHKENSFSTSIETHSSSPDSSMQTSTLPNPSILKEPSVPNPSIKKCANPTVQPKNNSKTPRLNLISKTFTRKSKIMQSLFLMGRAMGYPCETHIENVFGRTFQLLQYGCKLESLCELEIVLDKVVSSHSFKRKNEIAEIYQNEFEAVLDRLQLESETGSVDGIGIDSSDVRRKDKKKEIIEESRASSISVQEEIVKTGQEQVKSKKNEIRSSKRVRKGKVAGSSSKVAGPSSKVALRIQAASILLEKLQDWKNFTPSHNSQFTSSTTISLPSAKLLLGHMIQKTCRRFFKDNSAAKKNRDGSTKSKKKRKTKATEKMQSNNLDIDDNSSSGGTVRTESPNYCEYIGTNESLAMIKALDSKLRVFLQRTMEEYQDQLEWESSGVAIGQGSDQHHGSEQKGTSVGSEQKETSVGSEQKGTSTVRSGPTIGSSMIHLYSHLGTNKVNGTSSNSGRARPGSLVGLLDGDTNDIGPGGSPLPTLVSVKEMKIGLRVFAKMTTWDTFYQGTVLKVHPDGSANIKFDDGETRYSMPKHMVRIEKLKRRKGYTRSGKRNKSDKFRGDENVVHRIASYCNNESILKANTFARHDVLSSNDPVNEKKKLFQRMSSNTLNNVMDFVYTTSLYRDKKDKRWSRRDNAKTRGILDWIGTKEDNHFIFPWEKGGGGGDPFNENLNNTFKKKKKKIGKYKKRKIDCIDQISTDTSFSNHLLSSSSNHLLSSKANSEFKEDDQQCKEKDPKGKKRKYTKRKHKKIENDTSSDQVDELNDNEKKKKKRARKKKTKELENKASGLSNENSHLKKVADENNALSSNCSSSVSPPPLKKKKKRKYTKRAKIDKDSTDGSTTGDSSMNGLKEVKSELSTQSKLKNPKLLKVEEKIKQQKLKKKKTRKLKKIKMNKKKNSSISSYETDGKNRTTKGDTSGSQQCVDGKTKVKKSSKNPKTSKNAKSAKSAKTSKTSKTSKNPKNLKKKTKDKMKSGEGKKHPSTTSVTSFAHVSILDLERRRMQVADRESYAVEKEHARKLREHQKAVAKLLRQKRKAELRNMRKEDHDSKRYEKFLKRKAKHEEKLKMLEMEKQRRKERKALKRQLRQEQKEREWQIRQQSVSEEEMARVARAAALLNQALHLKSLEEKKRKAEEERAFEMKERSLMSLEDSCHSSTFQVGGVQVMDRQNEDTNSQAEQKGAGHLVHHEPDNTSMQEKLNNAPMEQKLNCNPMQEKLDGNPMQWKLNCNPIQQQLNSDYEITKMKSRDDIEVMSTTEQAAMNRSEE